MNFLEWHEGSGAKRMPLPSVSQKSLVLPANIYAFSTSPKVDWASKRAITPLSVSE